jgi:hypothetical protein
MITHHYRAFFFWPAEATDICCQFQNSEEAEVAVCDRLQIKAPDPYCDRIFKLVPMCDSAQGL